MPATHPSPKPSGSPLAQPSPLAPTPPRRPTRPWVLCPSNVGPSARATYASRSSTAASATPTCTRPATSGRAPCTPACRATRSSAASSRSAPRSRASSVGDLAGVGCMVDSCRTCPSCREGLEQYCENGPHVHLQQPGPAHRRHTYGGYSDAIVVDEALRAARPGDARPGRRRAAAVRRHHHLLAAAPLEGGPGPEGRHRRARRARATWASSSPMPSARTSCCSRPRPASGGRAAARRGRGRGLEETPRRCRHVRGSFDFILDTVSAPHDLDPYLSLLKRDGTLMLVGAPEQPLPVAGVQPDLRRRQLRRVAHRRHPRRRRRCSTSAPSTASRRTSR